jgi:hypothetical protein
MVLQSRWIVYRAGYYTDTGKALDLDRRYNWQQCCEGVAVTIYFDLARFGVVTGEQAIRQNRVDATIDKSTAEGYVVTIEMDCTLNRLLHTHRIFTATG